MTLHIMGITASESATAGTEVEFIIHTENDSIPENFKVELSGDLTGSQEFYLVANSTKDVIFYFIMPTNNVNIIIKTYHLYECVETVDKARIPGVGGYVDCCKLNYTTNLGDFMNNIGPGGGACISDELTPYLYKSYCNTRGYPTVKIIECECLNKICQ